MKTPDEPGPDTPSPQDVPASPTPGPGERSSRAADPGLADYEEILRRSLSEIDAALDADLPTVREPEGEESATREPGSGEWDRPAVLPYLTATLLALTAMIVLVLSTTLPAAGVFQIGLTFLAVAMVVRRLEDAPKDSDNPVVAWLHDRAIQLEGKFGVEFYGVAALTSFLRAEVDLVTGISIDGFLANPIGAAIVWFVSALMESIMNAVWASLWWFQLMQEVDGLPLLGGIIVAGWLVWRVLDITPDPEDG